MTKRYCDECGKQICDSLALAPNPAKPHSITISSGALSLYAQIVSSCSKDLCEQCYNDASDLIKENGLMIRIGDHLSIDRVLFDNRKTK